MARHLRRRAGLYGAELPERWYLDTGDEIVVSNATWGEIQDLNYDIYFDDLGATSDPVTQPFSSRDVQQVTRYVRDGVTDLGQLVVHSDTGGGGGGGGGNVQVYVQQANPGSRSYDYVWIELDGDGNPTGNEYYWNAA